MQRLIPIINQLQDVFSTVGERELLQLPQIVVVGAQSSGKSSVLENLVGRDFLPRGSGIVTRVPLVMQLNHIAEPEARAHGDGHPQAREWATFLHKPNATYTDFQEVRREIARQTEHITGGNLAISDKPIHLKIFSPSVVDLTLVDLPGITKVPVGNQPADIEAQVRQLLLTYARNPNSIILAVSPANSDFANSDALKLAREIDPEGARTIGVVTKLDLMDRGTDATRILAGEVIPVKLGIVGVVSRCQLDIDQGVLIEVSLEKEREFFEARYPRQAHRCGTKHLSAVLNKLLMHHIRDCLPVLRQRVKLLQQKTHQVLQSLGDPLNGKMDKSAALLGILTRFVDAVKGSVNGSPTGNHVVINGGGGGSNGLASSAELSGGARIFHVFHDTYGMAMQSIDALEGLSEMDIHTAIRNATGPRASLFVPEAAFECLVKEQIRHLLLPSQRCVEQCHEELNRIVRQCATQEMARFGALRDKVVEVVTAMLQRRLPATAEMVDNLIQIELAYINTNHPDFEGGAGAVMKTLISMAEEEQRDADHHAAGEVSATDAAAHPHRTSAHAAAAAAVVAAAPPPASPQKMGVLAYLFGRKQTHDGGSGLDRSPLILESLSVDDFTRGGRVASTGWDAHESEAGLVPRRKMEIDLIKSLLSSYFFIVRKRLQDSVPKVVMHFLVNHTQDNLQSELVTSLYREEFFDRLLNEDPHVAKQRKDAQRMYDALCRSTSIINEIAEFRG